MFERAKKQEGFILVEVLVTVALLALFFSGITGAWVSGLQSGRVAGDRTRALFLAEEGLAAVQNLRDADFTNLTNGTHGINDSGSQWAFAGTSDITDMFTREVTIATVDASTKSVTSTVSWEKTDGIVSSVAFISYFTNWITATSGGWLTPSQTGVLNLSSTQDGLRVQVSGDYAYIVRSSGSPDFFIVNITNPSTPTLVGSLLVENTITDLFVSGSYAYVTGQNNSAELRIINITNPASPTIVGTYDAPGNANAMSVFVSGTTAYAVRASSTDREFLAVNVMNPAVPVLLGSLDLGDQGNDVAVSGFYAYVASNSNTQEVQVVNITTPAAPTLAGSYNLSGTSNSSSIAANGNLVYFSNNDTLYILDDTTHGSPVWRGSTGLGGVINDITFDGSGLSLIFAATSFSTREFEVVNVYDPTAPVLIGYVNITGSSANGVAYDPVLDQVVMACTDNSSELITITHP